MMSAPRIGARFLRHATKPKLIRTSVLRALSGRKGLGRLPNPARLPLGRVGPQAMDPSAARMQFVEPLGLDEHPFPVEQSADARLARLQALGRTIAALRRAMRRRFDRLFVGC